MTIIDADDKVVANLGDGKGLEKEIAKHPDKFAFPHAMCVDSKGDFYVVEWIAEGGCGSLGMWRREGKRLRICKSWSICIGLAKKRILSYGASMSSTIDPSFWWKLHFRKARGQPLSAEEERLYLLEISRQDREAAPLNLGLDELRKLRDEIKDLERADAELRGRLAELANEIHIAEMSLSQASRAALGVTE